MEGVPNLARRLGAATPAYTAVCLAVAALLLPTLAPAAVLAAYGVGMAGSLSERLPTRVPAWAETVAVLILLGLLVPPAAALWVLCLMGGLQAADRYQDRRREARLPIVSRRSGSDPSQGSGPGTRTRVPALLALGLWLVAAGLAPALTGAGLVAAAALELLFKGGGERGRGYG